MPIKQHISVAIKAQIDKRIDKILRNILQAMHNVGLESVTEARKNHTYTDRTGNLTSSIGYVLMQDGEIKYQSTFAANPVAPNKDLKIPGGDGKEGAQLGESFAKELASTYGSLPGIQLIIVAGMPYAKYVEAHYNVLASAEIKAIQSIKTKVKSILNNGN